LIFDETGLLHPALQANFQDRLDEGERQGLGSWFWRLGNFCSPRYWMDGWIGEHNPKNIIAAVCRRAATLNSQWLRLF